MIASCLTHDDIMPCLFSVEIYSAGAPDRLGFFPCLCLGLVWLSFRESWAPGSWFGISNAGGMRVTSYFKKCTTD